MDMSLRSSAAFYVFGSSIRQGNKVDFCLLATPKREPFNNVSNSSKVSTMSIYSNIINAMNLVSGLPDAKTRKYDRQLRFVASSPHRRKPCNLPTN